MRRRCGNTDQGAVVLLGGLVQPAPTVLLDAVQLTGAQVPGHHGGLVRVLGRAPLLLGPAPLPHLLLQPGPLLLGLEVPALRLGQVLPFEPAQGNSVRIPRCHAAPQPCVLGRELLLGRGHATARVVILDPAGNFLLQGVWIINVVFPAIFGSLVVQAE